VPSWLQRQWLLPFRRNVQHLNSQKLSPYQKHDVQVLIVDSIGILNKLYRYADVAYIGGAFRTGLHNILEATAFGTPTVFGPDHSRFPDAGEMVKKNLAFSIRNDIELKLKIDELLNKNQSELHASILKFMESRTGATEATLEYTNEC
jgi:3-deoxy-D-manno-octulosonic-acid transferase